MSKPNKHKPIRYDKKSASQNSAQQSGHQSGQKQAIPKSAPNTSVKAASPEQYGLKDGKATLVFNATDTLFFRESRPMEAMGELQSVFPPQMRTLAGAVRTLIGEGTDVDWQDYQANAAHPLRQTIGYNDDLGGLSMQGVWMALDGERLYPAPLHLLKKDEQIYPLQLDKARVWCDLGRQVRLPKLPEDDQAKGSKPLENTWLTRDGLARVLAGKKPDANHIKTAHELFKRESRLGIGRENSTRSVIEGLLYQTEHIRPHADLTLEVDAAGLPENLPHQAIARLGGEGRSVRLSVQQKNHHLPECGGVGHQIALYLLTPLFMPEGAWLGFTREERAEQTVWTGSLNGIELELHGAVTGKVLRSGGWDMAKKCPRPVTSFVPAGSVFFCTVIGDAQTACNALHNQQIGNQSEYGYGHLAVGRWYDQ